jgi:hypothetical protein
MTERLDQAKTDLTNQITAPMAQNVTDAFNKLTETLNTKDAKVEDVKTAIDNASAAIDSAVDSGAITVEAAATASAQVKSLRSAIEGKTDMTVADALTQAATPSAMAARLTQASNEIMETTSDYSSRQVSPAEAALEQIDVVAQNLISSGQEQAGKTLNGLTRAIRTRMADSNFQGAVEAFDVLNELVTSDPVLQREATSGTLAPDVMNALGRGLVAARDVAMTINGRFDAALAETVKAQVREIVAASLPSDATSDQTQKAVDGLMNEWQRIDRASRGEVREGDSFRINGSDVMVTSDDITAGRTDIMSIIVHRINSGMWRTGEQKIDDQSAVIRGLDNARTEFGGVLPYEVGISLKGAFGENTVNSVRSVINFDTLTGQILDMGNTSQYKRGETELVHIHNHPHVADANEFIGDFAAMKYKELGGVTTGSHIVLERSPSGHITGIVKLSFVEGTPTAERFNSKTGEYVQVFAGETDKASYTAEINSFMYDQYSVVAPEQRKAEPSRDDFRGLDVKTFEVTILHNVNVGGTRDARFDVPAVMDEARSMLREAQALAEKMNELQAELKERAKQDKPPDGATVVEAGEISSAAYKLVDAAALLGENVTDGESLETVGNAISGVAGIVDAAAEMLSTESDVSKMSESVSAIRVAMIGAMHEMVMVVNAKVKGLKRDASGLTEEEKGGLDSLATLAEKVERDTAESSAPVDVVNSAITDLVEMLSSLRDVSAVLRIAEGRESVELDGLVKSVLERQDEMSGVLVPGQVVVRGTPGTAETGTSVAVGTETPSLVGVVTPGLRQDPWVRARMIIEASLSEDKRIMLFDGKPGEGRTLDQAEALAKAQRRMGNVAVSIDMIDTADDIVRKLSEAAIELGIDISKLREMDCVAFLSNDRGDDFVKELTSAIRAREMMVIMLRGYTWEQALSNFVIWVASNNEKHVLYDQTFSERAKRKIEDFGRRGTAGVSSAAENNAKNRANEDFLSLLDAELAY